MGDRMLWPLYISVSSLPFTLPPRLELVGVRWLCHRKSIGALFGYEYRSICRSLPSAGQERGADFIYVTVTHARQEYGKDALFDSLFPDLKQFKDWHQKMRQKMEQQTLKEVE